MDSYFDKIIDRGENSGTYSAKWQGFEARFPGYDVKGALPMWVADMDFMCPPEVIDVVVKRAQHGIYGYTSEAVVDAFKRAAAGWFERRYNWKTKTEWMLCTPGVVPVINASIQEFTDPGDGVIIQPPVYYPFAAGINNNGRIVKNNSLIERDGFYEIDFEDLEKLAKDLKTKLIILSNPHNPVGRVWTKEELYKICKICHDNHVLLFSDEIHGDLIMKGHTHIASGILGDEIKNNLIAAYAPSKTFNLAGLGASIIVVPNKEIRERLAKRILANRLPTSNVFGPIAGEAAYLYGDKYVDELMAYIEDNIDYAITYAQEHLGGVHIIKPEGTYLVWIDFRGTGMTGEEINSFILEKVKIAADLGNWFGQEGDGFARFNFACPRSIVTKALEQIKAALAEI